MFLNEENGQLHPVTNENEDAAQCYECGFWLSQNCESLFKEIYGQLSGSEQHLDQKIQAVLEVMERFLS